MNVLRNYIYSRSWTRLVRKEPWPFPQQVSLQQGSVGSGLSCPDSCATWQPSNLSRARGFAGPRTVTDSTGRTGLYRASDLTCFVAK